MFILIAGDLDEGQNLIILRFILQFIKLRRIIFSLGKEMELSREVYSEDRMQIDTSGALFEQVNIKLCIVLV